MLNIKKFLLAIGLVPKSTTEIDSQGELEVLNTDGKLRYHNGSSASPVVTESHSATLTNKTIDANGTGNSISNLETADLADGVLNTDLIDALIENPASDTQIPSALAVKTYVDTQVGGKDEADEIIVDPAVAGATNVQTALTNINTAINDHIGDNTDAHDASAISVSPSGNLGADDVQEALEELQTDIDTRATSTALTNHTGATAGAHAASAISVNPTGNLAADDVQEALGELQLDIDTRATSTALTNHTGATTGAHAASAISVNPTVGGASDVQTALTNHQAHVSASTNVHGLAVGSSVVGTTDTQELTNKTLTGASIKTPVRSDVKQDTIANLTTYAASATNGQIVFATDEKQMYQIVDNELVTVGGASTVTLIQGELLSVNDYVYISTGTDNDSARTAGYLYKVDASNDSRVDALGFVKKIIPSSSSTFDETFESGNFTANGWTVVNGTQTNKFHVGTATTLSGSYSAYISNDLGVSNAYTTTGGTSAVYFYKDLLVPSTGILTFSYKSVGEFIGSTPYDYGQIIIDPNLTVVPVAGVAITTTPAGGIRQVLSSTSSWTNITINLSAYSGSTVRIIFGWRNDSAIGTQPPLAIDNINLSSVGAAEVQTSGNFAGLSGLTAGKVYYASASTPGAITATPPSTNGQWAIPSALAVSASEIVINPVPSSSAIYITDSEYSTFLENGVLTPENVPDLLFDPIQVRSFIIEYSIYRSSNPTAQAKAQIGQLRGVYNTRTNLWLLSDDFAGESAGIEFSIQPSGQIQYTSSVFSVVGYDCVMKYAIKRTFTI
jgi:hypothetical protein